MRREYIYIYSSHDGEAGIYIYIVAMTVRRVYIYIYSSHDGEAGIYIYI